MPDQRELESAWQALAERERRGDEATRQRAAELEERSARVAALWEELGERSTELAAQETNLAEREHALAAAGEGLRLREGLVQDAEARVEAGRRQLVELETAGQTARRRAADAAHRERRTDRPEQTHGARAGRRGVAEACLANGLRDNREWPR